MFLAKKFRKVALQDEYTLFALKYQNTKGTLGYFILRRHYELLLFAAAFTLAAADVPAIACVLSCCRRHSTKAVNREDKTISSHSRPTFCEI
jgi:hypothetical protein